MPYSSQRVADGLERYRTRKIDARLATIEDDLDSGVIGGGGGGGAPTGAAYVTIGNNATLTAERALTAGSGITITDAGANSTVTIATTGAVGTATVNFGAFPGSSHATVAVTGQAGIVAGSVVQAWIRPVATADHSADEHLVETIRVLASDIVAGVGFSINAFNSSEKTNARGDGTRIYGAWTVAWSWA